MKRKVLAAVLLGITVSMSTTGVFAENTGAGISEAVVQDMEKSTESSENEDGVKAQESTETEPARQEKDTAKTEGTKNEKAEEMDGDTRADEASENIKAEENKEPSENKKTEETFAQEKKEAEKQAASAAVENEEETVSESDLQAARAEQSLTMAGKKKQLIDALGNPITKPGFYGIEDEEYNVKSYYVDENLEISKGNHTVYQREQDTVAWLIVDGKWYLVDANDGHLLSGWQEVGHNLYYLGGWGYAMVNGNQEKGGWYLINNEWYAFYSWGGARKGWYTYKGKTYYLQNGRMQTDSLQLDGKKYYFDKEGALYQDRVVLRWDAEEHFSRYYLAGEDGSIYQTPGWQQLHEKWYWIQDESGELLRDSWLDYKNNHYYLLSNGEMAADMTLDDYYFRSWGGRCENAWAQIERKWYYFGEDGKKYTGGWLDYKKNWYYVDDQGRMYANRWLDKTYYFKSWGGMCRSTWMQIDEDWYYFQKSGKKQQNGWVSSGGKWYWMDENGKMVSSCWKKIQNTWYYFKKDGSMCHSEWLKQGGHWYYFKSGGEMCQAESYVVKGVTYEFDQNGYWVESSYTELASKLKAAKKYDQMILVSASGTTATVAMVQKNADGKWEKLLQTEGYVGRGGIGDTTEWNAKTPTGQFSFTHAFGIKENPGTKLEYTQVDDTYYWVDDVNSPYYNQFVTTTKVKKDWASAEHLSEIKPGYNYVLALNYNPKCTPGVGSAIFLHCSQNRATGGCISVPEEQMVKILQNVKADCQIIIDTAEGLKKY